MLINFIGDIHGYASELKWLLAKLGYTYSISNGWTRGEGRLIFLGDLIDRGPEQKETVEIVRKLCELDYAICLTGNHEFNAVGFITKRVDKPGKYVRSHTDNHISQHQDFLDA
jgi:predicted MPP superfamily phosphohydrolase